MLPKALTWVAIFLVVCLALFSSCGRPQHCACGSYLIQEVLDSTVTQFAVVGEEAQEEVFACMGATDAFRREVAEGRFSVEVRDHPKITGVKQLQICSELPEKDAVQYVNCWMQVLGESDSQLQLSVLDRQVAFLEHERDSLVRRSDSLIMAIREMRRQHPRWGMEGNWLGIGDGKPSAEYAMLMMELEVSEKLTGMVQEELLIAKLKQAGVVSRVRIIEKGGACDRTS